MALFVSVLGDLPCFCHNPCHNVTDCDRFLGKYPKMLQIPLFYDVFLESRDD